MIYYKKRIKYKYNLCSNYEYETGIKVAVPKKLKFLEITADGKLFMLKGYSWDGPSGVAVDTKTSMQGSLVHDALYQLMREKVLPQSDRKRADEILKEVCIDDGMSKVRANYMYYAIRLAGAPFAEPEILQAP